MMRILVAFDGSASAERAALLVTRFGPGLQARAVLLGVGPRRGTDARQRQLRRLAERLEARGVPTTVRVAPERPAAAIVAELAREDYDLLVLDREPGGALDEDDAPIILRRQPVAALSTRRVPPELDRVLVCTGGGRRHRAVDFALAGRIAAAAGASVEILHVMSQVPLSREVAVDESRLTRGAGWHMDRRTREGRHLAALAELFADTGVRATPKVRHGLILDEVLAEVDEYGPDLVVVGAHQAPGLLDLLLDDMTDRLVTALDEPVLILPAGDRE